MSRFSSSLFLFAALLSACGPSPSTCVPGEQIVCACAGGASGFQRCGSDGTYGACACSETDAAVPLDAFAPVDAFVSNDAALDASELLDAGDAATGPDGGPAPPCDDQLDLLFMIDNSNSMAEEQLALSAELPRLVRVLATGDTDGDGTAELTPIGSLHVGVVTSDMGVGGHSVPTCGGGTYGSQFGDDGVLITRGRTAIPGCMATYPSIFEFMSGDSADAFAADVACVATAGTGGCGFEQQLEAVLKALSPSEAQPWTTPEYVPPAFVAAPGGAPTSGHAIGSNAGFIRPGSILAAVLVTDEEDCSASIPDVFNPSSPVYSGTDLNLRCFTYPETQQPIGRFITGLGSLRRDPRRLVFSVIAGVPAHLSGDTDAEYAAILADPDMVEEIDPSVPTRLRPSCNVPGRGVAFPPRRIVSVARGLDALGVTTDVQSICRESFAAPIDALLSAVDQSAAICD